MLAKIRSAVLGGLTVHVVLTLLAASELRAQDAGRPPQLEQSAGQSGASQSSDPRIDPLQALSRGELSVDVAPQSLFDVPLDDEAAVQVEAGRLRALLAALGSQGPVPQAGAPASVDRARWQARLALDRARLAFYELSPARRSELLGEHARRRETARPVEAEAERRAREAEAERRRALEAAEAARGEAERLTAEELARLIAIEARVERLHVDRQQIRQDLKIQREALLGWQRRAREAKATGSDSADRTYDALRGELRAERAQLASVLDALDAHSSQVPELPPDSLSKLPADAPVQQVRARRARLAKTLAAARDSEHALQVERAAVLVDIVATLNRERLGLLPYLSAAKRDAVTGFTPQGWDQASAEARHLALILRHQRHVTGEIIAAWRSGETAGLSLWSILKVAVPWLTLVFGFAWAKRRTRALLRLADLRLAASERAERRITASPQRRALRFVAKIQVPVGWGALLGASLWLLPTRARDLLEVQLLSTIFFWGIGMSLLVHIVNALAGGASGALWHEEESATGTLRLRSLRLVGRTVLVFALLLMLSARLVGQGTIFSWVASTCWLAVAPVLALLLRWWRGPVLGRLERSRKPSPFRSWALSHHTGWLSFVATLLAALQLLGVGALKLARRWLSGFDLARRAHAYLFRRELERMGETPGARLLSPLPADTLARLHPEAIHARWLGCPSDDLLERLVTRARTRAGGVVALIGARGMGKSALGRELAARVPGAIRCECHPAVTPEGFPQSEPPLVILDDAQALARPVIGGFALFDRMIALARGRCQTTLWVWLIDAALWPLLKRARDARPLFDETHLLAPWDETEIGALLAERCGDAGIAPLYEDLIDKLPAGADELDRLDALRAKQVGYERMLWDHVRGNPALALEAFRASLACDVAGVVHVRPLQAPDASQLEDLPDSALFVLRAVLQLGSAAIDDVAQATRLSPEQVWNALRFGQSRGFFAERDGRMSVSWAWLRAVVRLLERRHLLVSP